ncbi:hypothetical protein MPH_06340 [Macrophomina phaseolina MS6]|uniref:Uncharacterized protein n=1 Tax=Macrophomina phaseolina (strain MS6) TaxID=1126212 RepID=K2S264_MACPH|nr:hypothetical protein MPH_06340 [Macrophomina phaseolina MS6]
MGQLACDGEDSSQIWRGWALRPDDQENFFSGICELSSCLRERCSVRTRNFPNGLSISTLVRNMRPVRIRAVRILPSASPCPHPIFSFSLPRPQGCLRRWTTGLGPFKQKVSLRFSGISHSPLIRKKSPSPAIFLLLPIPWPFTTWRPGKAPCSSKSPPMPDRSGAELAISPSHLTSSCRTCRKARTVQCSNSCFT